MKAELGDLRRVAPTRTNTGLAVKNFASQKSLSASPPPSPPVSSPPLPPFSCSLLSSVDMLLGLQELFSSERSVRAWAPARSWGQTTRRRPRPRCPLLRCRLLLSHRPIAPYTRRSTSGRSSPVISLHKKMVADQQSPRRNTSTSAASPKTSQRRSYAASFVKSAEWKTFSSDFVSVGALIPHNCP